MAELMKEMKTYRVQTEQEAIDLINKFRSEAPSGGYDVNKANYVLKQKKAKGEIIDEYYIVNVEIKYV